MAHSFTRPDPATPASVSSAQFQLSRRGYDQAEVRDFLRLVAAEQGRLLERGRALERELAALRQAKTSPDAVIDEDTATRLLGEEAARVLQTAREAAAQIRTRAEESSARLLREATDEAQRLREEAEIEAARRRQDASADSEAELQMAKQQGRDMVNEARAYRERVLSELGRRRELARQQIEQLIHGRDRLLQAFERSRLAAVEVMAELTPLGEPNEYVNLQPTTGPVPLMIPGASRAPWVNPTGDYLLADAEPEASADTPSDATLAIDIVIAADDSVVEPPPETAVEASVEPVAESPAEPPVEVEIEVTVGVEMVEPAPLAAETKLSLVDDDAVTNVIALPDPVADAVTEASLAADAEREPAEVVSLFAGEMDSPSEPITAGPTVDDLFARLRAARAEVVIAKVAENAHRAEAAADARPDQTAEPAAVVDQVPDSGDQAPASDGSDDAARSVDEVVVPIILAAARKLKRVLADEQNEVLDTLRRKEPVRSLDALLPWEADHSGRYASAVENDLIGAAVAGADGGPDGGNPAIIRPALDAVTNEIVAPLRDRLIRCIDRAEGDNAELGNQVRTLYREWKTHRIDEHVEDIVRLAYERGALTLASR